MCINKKLIRNRKYTMTKKNGGNVPVLLDTRKATVWVPCQQCYICKKRKAREWRVRLTEDVKVNTKCKIVTLTFNTESLKKLAEECKGAQGYELDNEICKLAVKRFRERWRKKYGRSVRHWLITELGHGKTEHVHMHGIIWKDERYELEGLLLDNVEKIWGYGYVGKGKYDYRTGEWVNYVNGKTANYFMKYVNKIDEKHKEYKQIILTSAGIGKAYVDSIKAQDNVYKGKETNQSYNTDNGGKLPMPEYIRNKLYTEEQREEMSSDYLDKGITYIEGKEIKLDGNEAMIYRLQKNLREKNERLGYGNGSKNWDRKVFENQQRRKKHKERGLS